MPFNHPTHRHPIRNIFFLYPAVLVSGWLCLQSAALAVDPTTGVKATTVLKTTTSWNGAPLAYPQGDAEITGMIVEIAPGAETGWHTHPIPSFGMLLEGDLEVELKDGRKNHRKAGDTLAEVVNTLHNGRNTGDKPAKILVFYAGVVGMKVTVREPVEPASGK